MCLINANGRYGLETDNLITIYEVCEYKYLLIKWENFGNFLKWGISLR
jgi:hypothetical protein